MNEVPTLWHFTCEHGHAALGERAVARPLLAIVRHGAVPWTGHWVWFTSLPEPSAVEAGLTQDSRSCNRMATRYRLDETDPSDVLPWTYFRAFLPDLFARLDHDGARPDTWWVSPRGVAVLHDPIPATTNPEPRKATR